MAIKINGDTVIFDNKVFKVGSGTTAQRPASPQTGMIWFNTELNSFEGYDPVALTWAPIAGGGEDELARTLSTLALITDDSDIVRLASAQTLTNKTLGNYTETVFTISDGITVNLNPNNGPIQLWTLGDNRTPGQANWAAGQSITLMVDDGTARTITWATLGVVWETNGGTAPTLDLTGFTVIVLWKVGTTIYGARVGDA